MKTKKLLLVGMIFSVLIIFVGLNSCASQPPIAYMVKPWEQNDAQLIIERLDSFEGIINIELNGKRIGSIKSAGRHYIKVINEGTYQLRVRHTGGQTPGNQSTIRVYSEAIIFTIDNSGRKHIFRTELPEEITKETVLPLEYLSGENIELGSINEETLTEPVSTIEETLTGIERAIFRTCRTLISTIPENSRIVVLNVSTNNNDLSSFIVDELEFYLASSKKFALIARNTLDEISAERNFQITGENIRLSGEISDSAAVSIGQTLGANIVITGSISRTGIIQRLSIRAISVNNSQILTVAREAF